MAADTPEYDAALTFIREAMARERAFTSSSAPPTLAEALPHRDPLPDPELGPAPAHPTTAGSEPTPAGCQVVTAGWNDLEGVMILRPETEFQADLRAVIAAHHDRALTELLRAVPPGQVGFFSVVGEWTRPALAAFLEGRVIECGGGVCSFRGIKRGSGRLIDLPDPEFFGRPREAWVASPPPVGEGGLISRSKDPVLARFRALNQAVGRKERSQFVAEGPTLVERALSDGLPVEAIVYTPDLRRQPEGEPLLGAARAAGIRHDQITEGLMGTITTTRPVPVVTASVWAAFRDVPPIARPAASPLLVAEQINNPDNLGMVLRTADAAGAAAVVIAGEKSDPFHKNCVRAARGAVGRLPLFFCPVPVSYLAGLREAGFQVLGATGRAVHDLYACDLQPPLAIVVGNEQEGISPAVLDTCTDRVRIPMAPGQDFLNVGVAAGVLLYEAVRHRRRVPRN